MVELLSIVLAAFLPRSMGFGIDCTGSGVDIVLALNILSSDCGGFKFRYVQVSLS